MPWEWPTHFSVTKHPPYLRLSVLTAGVWNVSQTPTIMDAQQVHPNRYWSQSAIHKKQKKRKWVQINRADTYIYELVEIRWSGSVGSWNCVISWIMQQMLCPCRRTPSETVELISEVNTQGFLFGNLEPRMQYYYTLMQQMKGVRPWTQ